MATYNFAYYERPGTYINMGFLMQIFIPKIILCILFSWTYLYTHKSIKLWRFIIAFFVFGYFLFSPRIGEHLIKLFDSTLYISKVGYGNTQFSINSFEIIIPIILLDIALLKKHMIYYILIDILTRLVMLLFLMVIKYYFRENYNYNFAVVQTIAYNASSFFAIFPILEGVLRCLLNKIKNKIPIV